MPPAQSFVCQIKEKENAMTHAPPVVRNANKMNM